MLISGVAIPGFVIVLLIILVIIAVIVTIIVMVAKAAKRVVNNVENRIESSIGNVLGVADSQIMSAIREATAETEEGPKSVSAMTSLMLPKITKDFPEFEYDEQRERSNIILTDYFKAINERDADILSDVGRELTQNVNNIILQMKAVKKYKRYDNLVIHRTEITNYNKTAGRCVITFQSAVEYNYYLTDANGAVIDGNSSSKKQTKYNIDMIYVQNRELVENQVDAKSMNCPNCGAPLTMLGSKQCSYCGAPVVAVNLRMWVFSKIQEVTR